MPHRQLYLVKALTSLWHYGVTWDWRLWWRYRWRNHGGWNINTFCVRFWHAVLWARETKCNCMTQKWGSQSFVRINKLHKHLQRASQFLQAFSVLHRSWCWCPFLPSVIFFSACSSGVDVTCISCSWSVELLLSLRDCLCGRVYFSSQSVPSKFSLSLPTWIFRLKENCLDLLLF